jgi:hypothetical protein
MTNLVLHPTSTAQWHALVSEAEHCAGCVLNEDVESYLVFLLMRFTNRPQMLSRVLAMDYLRSDSAPERTRNERLRDIGDHCLLFSGLFPQHAERRMVKVSYFVGLGRTAYQQISDSPAESSTDIFSELSREFVALMDILQTIRELRNSKYNLTPLNAFDLWNETGSRHAYKVIRSITSACPVRTDSPDTPILM